MLSLIGVPIDSVGRAGGTEHAPQVLRELGLSDALGFAARDEGQLAVAIRGEQRDAATGVVGWPGVAATTLAVREAVAAALARGDVPVLLGGCCTLEPAAVAAALDVVGTVGLAHVDGHLDLYTGETSPTGEAADMPNAVLLGLGPLAWSRLLGSEPVLRGRDLVVVGHRDPVEVSDGLAGVAKEQGVRTIHADEVRDDPAAAVDRVLTRTSLPLWVHLDVDVLDELEFPATDYLLPGGLTLGDLRDVLLGIARSRRVIGFSLGCYNPDKDPGRSCGAHLVALLTDVLLEIERNSSLAR